MYLIFYYLEHCKNLLTRNLNDLVRINFETLCDEWNDYFLFIILSNDLFFILNITAWKTPQIDLRITLGGPHKTIENHYNNVLGNDG